MDFDALRHNLRVRSGEALAVSVALQLHRLLAAEDAGGGRRYCGAGGLTPLHIIARSSPSSFGELLERDLNTPLQLVLQDILPAPLPTPPSAHDPDCRSPHRGRTQRGEARGRTSRTTDDPQLR
ncbi:hypothetical protein ACQ4PT_066017 [Festuca glaucescens]